MMLQGITLNRQNRRLILLYLSAGILYFILHLRYMAEYIDDAWTLSWAYGFWEKDTFLDYVFGYTNSRGSVLFHRTYSMVYGFILSQIGWSRSNATLISTFCIWCSSFFWYKSLRKAEYNRTIAHTAALLMLVMEIYVALGNKLRVDALSFFLISLAFYLFISRRYFFAGLLSLVAFENHPISITYYFWVLGYLISMRNKIRTKPAYYGKGALLFIAGSLAGTGYYLFLQHEYLEYFFEETASAVKGHTFLAYFWDMQFAWRHLPEAFISLLALGIFLKKGYRKKYRLVLPLLLFSLLSTFVIRRGNYHYTAFVYPSVILLIAITAYELRKLKLLAVFLALYLLPQYGYLLKLSEGHDQKSYEQLIQTIVPDDGTPIVGNSGAWFALKERDFKEYGYFDRAGISGEALPSRFYLISTKEYRDNVAGRYEDHQSRFAHPYKKQLVTTLSNERLSIEVYEYRRE